MVVTSLRGDGVLKEKGDKYMVTEGYLTLGGEHTIQYADDVT